MVKIPFVMKVLFLTFLWNSVGFASGEEKTTVSGNNQIIPSQLNLLLDQIKQAM